MIRKSSRPRLGGVTTDGVTAGGFTLVEVLIVVGVLAVLLAILFPALSRVRQTARSTVCQSNLKTLGHSVSMYALDNDNTFPFPSISFGEGGLWFNAVDQYLKAKQGRPGATPGSAAATRSYKRFKQCSFWEDFGSAKDSGNQDPIVEAARFFKMNINLKWTNRPPRFNPITSTSTHHDFARVAFVKQPERFVLIGDGVSLDMVPHVNNQTESTTFVFDVNEDAEAGPGLRHFKGANILFVDSHVELVNNLKRIKDPLTGSFRNTLVDNWEGEYRSGSPTGALVNPTAGPDGRGTRQTMQQLGLVRNPNMPLLWSELGRLYR